MGTSEEELIPKRKGHTSTNRSQPVRLTFFLMNDQDKKEENNWSDLMVAISETEHQQPRFVAKLLQSTLEFLNLA